MANNKNNASSRHGLQVVTLCISTSLVLVLLGMVVASVFTSYNLSVYVRENLPVTMMLESDMSNSEAHQWCNMLNQRPYINKVTYISKDQVLKEQTAAMGSDPSEFIGTNPFQPEIEMQLKSEYANADSLSWISAELKKYTKVSDITYPKDLINKVNSTLSKISLVLLVLAALLTFVSFSLVNNTVRLGVYARRFSIHTMKLVGASWNFIRRPFVWQAIIIGIIAALFANIVLAGCVFALFFYDDRVFTVFYSLALLDAVLFDVFFGIVITAICADVSVRKFLKMKAGDLYKI